MLHQTKSRIGLSIVAIALAALALTAVPSTAQAGSRFSFSIGSGGCYSSHRYRSRSSFRFSVGYRHGHGSYYYRTRYGHPYSHYRRYGYYYDRPVCSTTYIYSQPVVRYYRPARVYVESAPYASAPVYQYGDARVVTNPTIAETTYVSDTASEAVVEPTDAPVVRTSGPTNGLKHREHNITRAPQKRQWQDNAVAQGWALLAEGEGAEARHAFSAAAANRAGSAMPKFGYALASGQLGELTRATWSMRRGLKIEPASFDFIALDPALEPMIEQLIGQYEDAKLFNHNDGDRAFMRAALYYLLGDFDKAGEAIDEAAIADDDSPSTANLRQLIEARRGGSQPANEPILKGSTVAHASE